MSGPIVENGSKLEERTMAQSQGTVCPGDVHQAIAQALARNALGDASHLDVGAVGGDVFVCGEVSSARAQQVILEAARQVPGVTTVRNLVAVREGAPPQGAGGGVSLGTRRTPHSDVAGNS
jgi:osmotically-inducible protein OsmY